MDILSSDLLHTSLVQPGTVVGWNVVSPEREGDLQSKQYRIHCLFHLNQWKVSRVVSQNVTCVVFTLFRFYSSSIFTSESIAIFTNVT